MRGSFLGCSGFGFRGRARWRARFGEFGRARASALAHKTTQAAPLSSGYPVSEIRSPVSLPSGFVELSREQRFEFVQHRTSVFAGGDKLHFRTFAGGEHHKAHDALPVDLFLVLFDEDVRFELVGNSDD